jgi:hypothetical protein
MYLFVCGNLFASLQMKAEKENQLTVGTLLSTTGAWLTWEVEISVV